MNDAIIIPATCHVKEEPELQESKLENVKLTVQLQCQNDVIQKLQTLFTSEEKLLHESLEKIWSNASNFMEESSEFHENFGISSSWWNTKIMSLQQADIQNTEGSNREKQQALKSLQTEIEKISVEVQAQREEIFKLKDEIADHDAQFVEQKMMEEMLQQEPFGTEFTNLKVKLQRVQDTCQRLETVVNNKENKKQTEARKRGSESLENEYLPTILTERVVHTKESTTFVYRTSHGTRIGTQGKRDTKQVELIDL